MKNYEDIEKFEWDLIGFEGTLIDVSNKLVSLGCEDICYFGNWEEILLDKNFIVATDNYGDEHLQIYFDVIEEVGKDEIIESTIIKIIYFDEF